MKNFNGVLRVKLALFLSGILFCEPAASAALKLESKKNTVSEKLSSGVSYGNVCPCATVPVVNSHKTKKTKKIEKIHKISKSVKLEEKAKADSSCPGERAQILLDSQGNLIHLDQGSNITEVADQSKNKKTKKATVPSKKSVNSSDTVSRKNNTAKRKKIINGKKAVVSSASEATKDTRVGSNYKRGMTLTVGHEFTSSFSGSILGRMREYGALVPLIGRNKGLLYVDSKVKFYDGDVQEISAGVVVRRKLSKSMTGGLNFFKDMRNTPEHLYTWHSIGAEMFFKVLSVSGNYYFSSKDGHVSEVKKLTLDSSSKGNSVVLLREKLPADGYDARAALQIGNKVKVYGSIFSFHSPYDKSVGLNGYRIGSNISFNLNRRFVFSVNPEFTRDNKDDIFSTKFSFTLPIGRDYGNLLEHVVRDRDIILLESDNEYKVESVFLDAGERYQIKKFVEVKTGEEISTGREDSREDLYHIGNPSGEVNVNPDLNDAILAGDADLELHVSDRNGGTRVIPYHITNNGKEIKFPSSVGRYKNLLVTGLKVDLGKPDKYEMEHVEFHNDELTSRDGPAFQDDKDVMVTNSKITLNKSQGQQKAPQHVFYAKKEFYAKKGSKSRLDTPQEEDIASYHIRDSEIHVPGLDLIKRDGGIEQNKFAVFGSERDAKIGGSVGGTITITTKEDKKEE